LYKRLAVALFAVLAIAVVAAGCGGGGSSSSSGSTGDTTGGSTESSESGSTTESSSGGAAPTKAVFIKEADAICSKADAKLSEEITEYAKENNIPLTEEEPSEDDQAKILEAVVFPNISVQAEELEALTPPEGEEDKVEEITSTLSDEVAEAEENPGDVSEDTLEGATEKAQAYGLKTCGS
jgi:hypothetical protein